jgi:hypothetical protein
MTPAVWLTLACVASVILGGILGACIAWQIAFDRGFEEACGNKRHRHRAGGPQQTTLLELPRAGRPEPETPMPPTHSEWMFFGGAQVQPQPGPAEYQLLTAPTVTMTATTTTTTASLKLAETPSAWTKRMGLEMDEYISKMHEESNYFQHTILAEHLTREGGAR